MPWAGSAPTLTARSSRADVVIPVVADADTLFGATTRGLLIHLDYQGSIRLHWSPLILDELSRALVDTGRKPDHASARRHEQLMRAALPEAEIPTKRVQAHFADVQQAMRSAKDVHVAACAATILADGFYPGAQVVNLVTKNIRDFGVRKLEALGIKVQRPDTFLLARFQQDPPCDRIRLRQPARHAALGTGT